MDECDGAALYVAAGGDWMAAVGGVAIFVDDATLGTGDEIIGLAAEWLVD